MADVDVDLTFEAGDLRRELAIEHGQRLEVDGDANGLHPCQDRNERQFDFPQQPIEPDVGEPSLERFAHGNRRQGLETRLGRCRQLRCRGQDLVEVLGDHVGDRLAAERGVQDVGRDLRVEGDRWWRSLEVIGE